MEKLDGNYWTDVWEYLAHDADSWAYKASELVVAAERLRGIALGDHPQTGEFEVRSPVSTQMIMLYGMAVECLLKGIAARNGFEFVTQTTRGPKFNKVTRDDHRLEQLAIAEKVAIHVSASDEALLVELGYYIKFLGRYPISIRPLEGFASDGDETCVPRFEDPAQIALRAERLIRRLFRELGITRNTEGFANVPLPDP